MADNLTVGSPGAGAVHTAPNAEVKEKPVDKGADELNKLKDQIKKRFGQEISDTQAQRIAQRQQARETHKARIAESKAGFETSQAKETSTTKQSQAMAQAAKTAGTQEVRSAKDGLTAEQRQQISSNPDAGPTLPPTMAKPATPEQAKKLATTMLTSLDLGGQTVDLEAYAKTIKKLPPSQPKQSANGAGKTPAGTREAPGQQRGVPGQPGQAKAPEQNPRAPGDNLRGQGPQTPGQPGAAKPGTARPGEAPAKTAGADPKGGQPGQTGAATQKPAPGQSPGAKPALGQAQGASTAQGGQSTTNTQGSSTTKGSSSPQQTKDSAATQGGSPARGGAGVQEGAGKPGQTSPGAGQTKTPAALGQHQAAIQSQQTRPPGTPNPVGRPGQPGVGGPGLGGLGQTSSALTASSMQRGGGAQRTGKAKEKDLIDELFNAGGGLHSDASFDGMNFNWDAFFTLFLIKHSKGMFEWKKLMRQVKKAAFEAELAGHDLAITLQEFRNHMERINESVALAKQAVSSTKGIIEGIAEDKVDNAVGAQPENIPEHEAALSEAAERGGYPGRTYLTDEEIQGMPEEAREAYGSAMDDLRHDGGELALAEGYRGEANRLRELAESPPEPGEGGEGGTRPDAESLRQSAEGLDRKADQHDQQFEQAMQSVTTPRQRAILADRRAQYADMATVSGTRAERTAEVDSARSALADARSSGDPGRISRAEHDLKAARGELARFDAGNEARGAMRRIDQVLQERQEPTPRALERTAQDMDGNAITHPQALRHPGGFDRRIADIDSRMEALERGTSNRNPPDTREDLTRMRQELVAQRDNYVSSMSPRIAEARVQETQQQLEAARRATPPDPARVEELQRTLAGRQEDLAMARRGPLIDGDVYRRTHSQLESEGVNMSDRASVAEARARADAEVERLRGARPTDAPLVGDPEGAGRRSATAHRDLAAAQARAQVLANQEALLEARGRRDALPEAQPPAPGEAPSQAYRDRMDAQQDVDRVAQRMPPSLAREPGTPGPPTLEPRPSSADLAQHRDADTTAMQPLRAAQTELDQALTRTPPPSREELEGLQRNVATARDGIDPQVLRREHYRAMDDLDGIERELAGNPSDPRRAELEAARGEAEGRLHPDVARRRELVRVISNPDVKEGARGAALDQVRSIDRRLASEHPDYARDELAFQNGPQRQRQMAADDQNRVSRMLSGGVGRASNGAREAQDSLRRAMDDQHSDTIPARRGSNVGGVSPGGAAQVERESELEKTLRHIEDPLRTMGDSINSGEFQGLVDKAVSKAIGYAQGNRKTTTGTMSATMSKAQGMLNQLIQVMGQSRAR